MITFTIPLVNLVQLLKTQRSIQLYLADRNSNCHHGSCDIQWWNINFTG